VTARNMLWAISGIMVCWTIALAVLTTVSGNQ
jgi:hypothetical protein